jgi:hypothetical protein
MATIRVADSTIPKTRDNSLIAAPIAGMIAYLVAIVINIASYSSDGDQDALTWVFTFAITAVLTGLAIWLGLRAARKGARSMGKTSAILGVLGFIGILVFWTGLPAVFGATAIALSLAIRRSTGSFSGPSLLGIVLGSVALVAGVGISLVG